MPAKLVCAECQCVFDPVERGGRIACPQCGAAANAFEPIIEPESALPVARRARPKDDDSDDRPIRPRRRRREEDRDDEPEPRDSSSLWIILGVMAFFALAIGGLGYIVWSRAAAPNGGPVAAQPNERIADPAPPNPIPPPRPKPIPNRGDLKEPLDRVPAPRPDPFVLPPTKPRPNPNEKKSSPDPVNPRTEIRPAEVPPPMPFVPNPPPGFVPAPAPKPARPIRFPAVEPLPIEAKHDVKDRRTLTLPGEVAAVCIGGGGRFVCFHFEKLRQIGIFDMTVARIAKYLPVTGDGIAMAAGMDRLVVYDRNADVFVRWNLRTFEKEATLSNPTGKPASRLLMGAASAGPLVLVPKTDPNGWGGGETAFVDPVSFKLYDVANPFKNTGRAPNWNAATISDDGQLIVGPIGWGSNGEFLFFRPGNPPDSQTVPGIHAATARPSSDGRFVYSVSTTHTASGTLVPAAGGIAAEVVVPSFQRNLVFRAFNRNTGPGGAFPPFHDRAADEELDFKFYMEGQPSPFVTWTRQVAPVKANRYNPNATVTVDQRYFLVPDAKLLVILSSSNDKLFLHSFDVDEELEKSGIDYLFVASRPPAALFGKPFSYPIEVKSRKGGVKYKLESGPDGMKVAADGKLTWAVPRDAEPASVLLTISDASGREVFHNFTLEPVKDEPMAAAVPIPPEVAVTVRPPVIPNPIPAVPSIFEVSTKVFPLTPTKAEDGAEVKLPGEVDGACAAGGGRFLILHIPSAKQLAILDLCEGKVAKYLPLAEEKVLFAAGMNKLFVLNPSANVLQRYDLTTFEKDLTTANPVDGAPYSLTMGHASEGPLLVVTGGVQGWTNKHAFLNAKTLRPIDLKAPAVPATTLRFSEGPVRVSSDGRVYGFWRANLSPTGLDCFVLGDDGGTAVYREHTTAGAILPGADGTLHTATGLYTPQLKPIDRAAPTGMPRGLATIRVPAAHGPFYLEIDHNARAGLLPKTRPPKGATGGAEPKEPAGIIAVKMIGELAPLTTLNKAAGFVASTTRNLTDTFGRLPGLQFYDRFHYVPAANVLAVIDTAKTSVFFTRLNVKEKLAASGTDYLLAFGKPPATVRGTKFAYAPEVWSKAGGIKFRVEAGPEGMAADAAGLTWNVPKDSPLGTVDVILLVSNAAGRETFHTFKLSIVEAK